MSSVTHGLHSGTFSDDSILRPSEVYNTLMISSVQSRVVETTEPKPKHRFRSFYVYHNAFQLRQVCRERRAFQTRNNEQFRKVEGKLEE